MSFNKKKYYSINQKVNFVHKFNSSNLNRAEFCRQNNISKSAFYYWYKKYNNQDVKQNYEHKFIPVKVTGPSFVDNDNEHIIKMTLPNGINFEFSTSLDINYLRSILQMVNI